MAENHDQDQTTERITTVTKAVGAILLIIATLVPSSLSEKFNAVRKAVIAAAGSLLSVAASLDGLHLTGAASAWVGYGVAAATAAATWAVPNRS